jgi:hypothetical protein
MWVGAKVDGYGELEAVVSKLRGRGIEDSIGELAISVSVRREGAHPAEGGMYLEEGVESLPTPLHDRFILLVRPSRKEPRPLVLSEVRVIEYPSDRARVLCALRLHSSRQR